MHATYAFLLSLDLDDPGADHKTAAVAIFDDTYAHKTDENNWYSHEAVVLSNGTALQLADSDDYRGRDTFVTYFTNMPVSVRWRAAQHWAYRVVAADMELKGSNSFALSPTTDGDTWIQEATPEEITAAIETEVPQRLSEMFLTALPLSKGYDDNFIQEYRREKLAEMYLAWRKAHRHHTPPFSSRDLTPYDGYRAIDLTDGEQGNAILFTDIHT